MARAVHGRTNQVCKSGVQYEELLGSTLLHIQHTGYEMAALSDDRPPGLEMQLLTGAQFQMTQEAVKVFCKTWHGIFKRRFVIDAEAAPYIDVGEVDIGSIEGVLQFIDTFGQRREAVQVQNLRADMKMQSYAIHTGQFRSMANGGNHVLHRYAEFVFGHSGGNLLVRVCIDIGVDAQRHAGFASHLGCQVVDIVQLGQTLHIETENIVLQSGSDFPVAFPHAGKNDFSGRETGINSCPDFPTAHAVCTQSGCGDGSQQFGIGIGLDGVMYMQVLGIRTGSLNFAKRGSQQLHIVIIKRGLPRLKAFRRKMVPECHGFSIFV